MKCDQVAYYCIDENAEAQVKRFLGLEKAEWIQDKVTANSIVRGFSFMSQSVGLLQFNYDLGIEIEILRYESGRHWHSSNPDYLYASMVISAPFPFISHIGYHVEEFPNALGADLVQETWTESHTSEYLTTGAGKGRKYHYRIYQLGATYQKFIKRINP
jgi:hypothetical protein